MANRRISARELELAVSNILKDFSEDVVRITKEDVDTVTDMALQEVKAHAPVRTGKYKRSLKSRTEYESATEKRNVIYSKGQGSLTHLLENGHAKRNGGRTRSFPHFAYGQKVIEEELPKLLEKHIKEKGG